MSKTVYLVTAVTIMKLVFIEAILARERSVTNCLQQEIIKKEEYDIYSMLIDQNFGSGQDYLLTVEDQTWGFSDNYESWALLIRRLKQEKCNVKSDTLNNYFNLNKSRYYLKSHFTTATSVLLLHDEMDKIHNDYQRGADGWKLFRQRYPKSKGLIVLSRIGINKNKDQAIITIGYGLNLLEGGSELFLLTKDKGDWKIKSRIFITVS